MKKYLVCFLIMSSSLFTYSKTGFELGIREGYREDDFYINTTLDVRNLPHKDTFKNLKIFQTTGFFEGRYNNFFIKSTTNYGWILSGEGEFLVPIDTPDPMFRTTLHDKIRGNVFDIFGNIGYGTDLSRLIFLPQIGYGLYTQDIKRSPTPTNVIPLQIGVINAIIFSDIDFTKNIHKNKWWGFHYGADIIFILSKHLELHASYFYHDLYYRFKDLLHSSFTVEVQDFGIVDQSNAINNVSIKSKKGLRT